MGRSLHPGYALVAALLVLVGASLAVTLAVGRAQVDAQRELEAELLFVGDQYRRAIADYFIHPPLGQPASYPLQLEDLIEDRRGPVARRWLRRLYPDPVTGEQDWQLERVQGRIVGVYSPSGRTPLRHGGFEPIDAAFAGAASYREWRFLATAALAQLVAQGLLGGSGTGTPAGTAPGSSPGAVPGSTPQTVPLPPSSNPYKNCYLQYSVPMSSCSNNPPPMGHDGLSCQLMLQQLLDQCLAALPKQS